MLEPEPTREPKKLESEEGKDSPHTQLEVLEALELHDAQGSFERIEVNLRHKRKPRGKRSKGNVPDDVRKRCSKGKRSTKRHRRSDG